MTTRSAAALLALMLAPVLVPAAVSRASAAERFFCPKTVFWMPRNPRVCYKRICPKRICPDCPIENFGYFPACWQRWPFPLNYCHCPVPPITLNAPQSSLDQPAAQAKTAELPMPGQVEPETKPDEKKPPEPTLP